MFEKDLQGKSLRDSPARGRDDRVAGFYPYLSGRENLEAFALPLVSIAGVMPGGLATVMPTRGNEHGYVIGVSAGGRGASLAR